MSLRTIGQMLEAADRECIDADSRENTFAFTWLLRELNGAVADTIDRTPGVSDQVRQLEIALRNVLSNSKAVKALEDAMFNS